jgi:hypothetical protein
LDKNIFKIKKSAFKKADFFIKDNFKETDNILTNKKGGKKMKIDNNVAGLQLIKKTNENKKNPNNVDKENKNNLLADQYVPSKNEAPTTYSKPNWTSVESLKEESEKIYFQLRKIVQELLERQGHSFKDLQFNKDIKVDEIAQKEAAVLISDGGELSPENVSSRLVDFAISISGGDTSKAETLRNAIIEGFKEAEKIWGGTLPDISYKTFDLAMEKLDNWIENNK